MGNYNTWGGKNNRWGNKNRKNKTNSNTHYEPNKLFNTIAGGIVLFICCGIGLSILSSTFTGIKNTLDTADKVKSVIEPNTANTTKTNNTSYKNNIIDKIDIDSEDVKDILEYLNSELSNYEVESGKVDTILLNYDTVYDADSYKENIIDKLGDYKNKVSFTLVYQDTPLDEEEAFTEMNNIVDIVGNNSDLLSDTGFSKVLTSGMYNSPRAGNYIVSITFIK